MSTGRRGEASKDGQGRHRGDEQHLGQGEGDKDEGDEDDTEDEVRRPWVKRRPDAPTQREREEHLPIHLPYRSWCPHCRAGAGCSNHHKTWRDHDDKIWITVSLDYAFMGEEERDESARPSLVMYDHNHVATWAFPVDRKGATGYAVQGVLNRLEESGYTG